MTFVLLTLNELMNAEYPYAVEEIEVSSEAMLLVYKSE